MKPSTRVPGTKYTYQASRPNRHFGIGAYEGFIEVNHKGRQTIAWAIGGTYLTRHTLGPAQVRLLIAWLCRYLNENAPTDATKAIQKTKHHAKMVAKEQDRLMQQFLGENS